MTVFTAYPWRTNSDLVADIAQFGYFEGSCLDPTYGWGNFYNKFRPADLTGCDLDPRKSPYGPGESVDFRKLPFEDLSFDTVIYDPPYRMSGRPDRGEFDERYGTQEYTRWQDRYQLIYDGLDECARVARKYVLQKVQDQVVSGKKRWMTIDFPRHMEAYGFVLEDKFDMLTNPRPQPPGRTQKHSQINYSTLLVFRRDKDFTLLRHGQPFRP